MGMAFATAPSMVINHAGFRRASSSWGKMFEAEFYLGLKDEETNDIVEVFKVLSQDLEQSSESFKQFALFLNIEIAANFNYPTVLRTSLEKEEVNTEALNLKDGEEDEPQEFASIQQLKTIIHSIHQYKMPSRKKTGKATDKSALPSLASLGPDKIVTRRWTNGLPETADYYYDAEVRDVTKKLKEYPPDKLDLSDAWVVAIVNSKLSREERGAGWPTVFTNRGALRAGYVHKGQAAKLFDPETNGIRYALLFGEHNMIGTEGMTEGLPTRRPTILSDADPVTHGLLAQVQDLAYDDIDEDKAQMLQVKSSSQT